MLNIAVATVVLQSHSAVTRLKPEHKRRKVILHSIFPWVWIGNLHAYCLISLWQPSYV